MAVLAFACEDTRVAFPPVCVSSNLEPAVMEANSRQPHRKEEDEEQEEEEEEVFSGSSESEFPVYVYL